MKKIVLFLILSMLSVKVFAVSIQFKESEITQIIKYDGGVAIWTKGNKEKAYYVMISEKKEGMLNKNMVNKNGEIYFSNIGDEIFVFITKQVEHNDHIRNKIPLWLFIFSGIVILLFFVVLYYCRKYLVKHV